MSRKLTNLDVDIRLVDKEVIRVGEYNGNKVPILFKCLVDGHEWLAQPGNIFAGKGCPKCAGKMQLSNEIVDSRLRGRQIRRVSDYIKNDVKILWECLVDGHKWKAIPSSIFIGKGCPRCAGKEKLNDEIIDDRIKNRSILREGSFVDTYTKIKWRCKIDNFEWDAVANSILQGTGCPRCVGLVKLSNDVIDNRLYNTSIVRIGEYKNARTKIEFLCAIDGKKWVATPDNITNFRTGCPHCKNKDEARIFEFLCKTIGERNVVRQKYVKISGRKYYIDFCVKGIFIEYNGHQHYQPVEFFGGETKFKKQQKRDEELRQYCRENNIPLIEIKYDQPDKLNWLKNEIDGILNKEEKAA